VFFVVVNVEFFISI